MSDCIGWIVRSTAGHDRDALFCVVKKEENFFFLADGKTRKLQKPKRKKERHVDIMYRAEMPDPTIQKLQCGNTVSDRELRRMLAAFKGGNHAWQKTI